MRVSDDIVSGLLTSNITSPVASSQKMADITISFSKILEISDLVLSSWSRIDGSVLTINRFFKVFESEDK